jgi:hypothetical protein
MHAFNLPFYQSIQSTFVVSPCSFQEEARAKAEAAAKAKEEQRRKAEEARAAAAQAARQKQVNLLQHAYTTSTGFCKAQGRILCKGCLCRTMLLPRVCSV